MTKAEELSKEYKVADGRDYGYPTKLYNYVQEGSNGVSGEPGTGSNDDDTDTVINKGNNSSNSVKIEKYEGLQKEIPTVQKDQSSLAIVALRYKVYNEADLEKDGSLDNMTFEEYIAANNKRTEIQLTTEQIQLVANATGVDTGKITVLAYEVPKFVAKTDTSRSLKDYLMIILAVLIIALLIFVVLRGTAPVKVADEEPELSVEQLLATTKENQSLEDIEFSDKSETRKMIEKFVDENPEAVAQLLRNWLNDDWS